MLPEIIEPIELLLLLLLYNNSDNNEKVIIINVFHYSETLFEVLRLFMYEGQAVNEAISRHKNFSLNIKLLHV